MKIAINNNMRHKDWLYKKIYEDHYGKIPKGYHVHHKDGDRTNNHPSNLQVVTPKEHYKIHYEQGDFEAAALLSKHFDLSESDLSKLSKKLSEKGKAYWRDHPERKIQNSNYMKKRWKDNWEELAEQARKNGRGHIPWNKGIKLPGTGFPKGNTYGNANKGRKFPSIKCPYCNLEGTVGNMHRWHFDNCKTKENR